MGNRKPMTVINSTRKKKFLNITSESQDQSFIIQNSFNQSVMNAQISPSHELNGPTDRADISGIGDDSQDREMRLNFKPGNGQRKVVKINDEYNDSIAQIDEDRDINSDSYSDEGEDEYISRGDDAYKVVVNSDGGMISDFQRPTKSTQQHQQQSQNTQQQNQYQISNSSQFNLFGGESIKQSKVSSPYNNHFFSGGSLPIFERVKTAHGIKKKSNIFKSTTNQLDSLNQKLDKYGQSEVYVGSQDLQQLSQRPSTIHSNFGRVQSKRLQPTISLSQQRDKRVIAEKSFITTDQDKLIQNSNDTTLKGMEHDQILSDLQLDQLQVCLRVSKLVIHDYNDINEEYYAVHGKNFVEDPEPTPICHYERDPNTGDIRIDKMRNILPKSSQSDEFARMTQRERDEYMKNQQARDVMEGLIRILKKRDTKTNIEVIQKELDELAARNNPLKKCLSMYKIKQKMDQLKESSMADDDKFTKKDTTLSGDRPTSNRSRSPNKTREQSRSKRISMDLKAFRAEEQLSQEEEGKMRYKILTNFVNAYKEKMFLSSSVGFGDSKTQAGEKNTMTLQDLKEQAMAERQDITLDFEQFMRIYNFEKNRSTTGKNSVVFPGVNQSAEVKKETKISKSYHRNGKEKSFIPSPVNTSADNTFKKRPLSSFGREIQDQKNKLMRKTNQIRRNVEENKSLIENVKQRKRQEQDDIEIAKQVDMIKKRNFNKRSSRQNDSQNRNSQANFSEMSPEFRQTGTKSGYGMIQDGSTQYIRGGTPITTSVQQVNNQRPQTTGATNYRGKNRRLVSGGIILNQQENEQHQTFDMKRLNSSQHDGFQFDAQSGKNILQSKGPQYVVSVSGSQSNLGSQKVSRSLCNLFYIFNLLIQRLQLILQDFMVIVQMR
ncbi:UNKNOWN [Stylonychia lemnae]|uniref:Uncharacterized protein n=1 Tax=Stylonychia lemnae TaxID=5949 RepID=A0A078A5P5_STYLE|nr:UNKNOWN [Stylonychia lemnae]|eukprot:CDW76865.1 UNKNOWN [Stylonychia lemnae]